MNKYMCMYIYIYVYMFSVLGSAAPPPQWYPPHPLPLVFDASSRFPRNCQGGLDRGPHNCHRF